MGKNFLGAVLSFFMIFNSGLSISEKKIVDDSDTIKIDISYPEIQNESKKQIINKINSKIKSDIDIWMGDLMDLSKKANDESKQMNFDFRKFELNSSYDVKFNKDNIISIIMDDYQYTGGAHGITTRKSYNYDIEKGSNIKLSNMFKKGFDYKKIINEEITSQIKKEPDIYFSGGEGFMGIKDNQDFYLEDTNLVVYFSLYEIAPYSSGIREFKIPLSKLKDGM